MASYEGKVKKLLKSNGWARCRQPRGSHEIWSHNDNSQEITVPSIIKKRHTANHILKAAGIDMKL
jgi:predicted RNA binding protein YcfA (HicA-like mRNA interferase family)